MVDLARNGFTEDEIKRALHGVQGSRTVKFRYDLVRNNVVVGQLPVLEASIRYQDEDSVKRTGRFSMLADIRVNWISDRIKPYMLLKMKDSIVGANRPEQWAEFPLGVFIPSTPVRHFSETAQVEVEAYDLSIILKEDCVTERKMIEKGSKYIPSIVQLLNDTGITDIIYTDSDLALRTDREFEPGTSILEIINTLLTEMGYRTLTVNAEGIFLLKPYEEAGNSPVGYQYHADKMSVISRNVDTEMDLYSVPNVFVGIVSNPDYSSGSTEFESFRTEVINDDPDSPLSTVSRGRRIVKIFQPEDIASQSALDSYVQREAYRARQVYENITFETALMPIHEGGDVIAVSHPDIVGAYEETGWEMDLKAGGTMIHNARRLKGI